MLEQVEEGLLPPLDVVEDRDQRSLLFEQLADRPGDLLGRGGHVRLAEQRTDRRSGRLVRGLRVELLEDLDNRPIGDPLAVGEAAALDDASYRRRRAPPRPGGTCPRRPHRRWSRARSADRTARGPRPPGGMRARPSVRRTAPRAAPPARLGRAGDGGRRRAPPCPSSGVARPARCRRPTARARASAPRSALRPGPPPPLGASPR